MTKQRFYQMAEHCLLQLGGWVVLLVVLRPQWRAPGDFYLGYPERFYITQSDVMASYVSIPWFLWDVLVCGLPVFGVLFLLLYALAHYFRGVESSEDHTTATDACGNKPKDFS